MARTRGLKFCVHIHGCGSYPKICKVGYSGFLSGVTRCTFKFCDCLHNSGMAAATVQGPVCAVRAVHSTQPLPKYFGLLCIISLPNCGQLLWKSCRQCDIKHMRHSIRFLRWVTRQHAIVVAELSKTEHRHIKWLNLFIRYNLIKQKPALGAFCIIQLENGASTFYRS